MKGSNDMIDTGMSQTLSGSNISIPLTMHRTYIGIFVFKQFNGCQIE